MELNAPNPISDTSFYADIETDLEFVTEVPYEDPTEEPMPYPTEDNLELRNGAAILANKYEEYSKKWFHQSVLSAMFLRKVVHSFHAPKTVSYTGNSPTVRVRQTWRPEQLLILERSFQIKWHLVKFEYIDSHTKISGSTTESAAAAVEGAADIDIPFAPSTEEPFTIHISLRARAKRQLRKARLRAAMAKWKVNELTRKYYEKYGTLEGGDKESVLSSDLDSHSSSDS